MPNSKKSRSRRGTKDPTNLLAPVRPADRLYVEIRKFIAAAILFNTQVAEKVGLSPTEMQMVSMLQVYGPSTPGRLAAATGLSSGGVTVALDRLEKSGYIRRQPNPADRRSLLVALIPSAVVKLARLYEGVAAQMHHLLETMPEGDLEVVIRFFELMGAHQIGSSAPAVK
jgi:DNA-binding MarR family transcriptional regulator